jgi:hypothetical protein
VRQLYDLAVLGVGLIVVGAVLAAPNVQNEQRFAAIAAVIGAWILVARLERRRTDDR